MCMGKTANKHRLIKYKQRPLRQHVLEFPIAHVWCYEEDEEGHPQKVQEDQLWL